MIQVISPGQKVDIADAGIRAIVLEVCVKPNCAIQYRVAWWFGNDRKCEWLESCEVEEIVGSNLTTIEFANRGRT